MSKDEALKLALEALCVAVEPKKGKVYAREFEPIDCFAMHEQAITALREALAQPPLPVQPEQEQPCYCGPAASLQMVSGGAAPEGYLGKVTLLIDGAYVDYVKAQPPLPVQKPDELTIAYMSGLYDGKKKRPWVGLTNEEISATSKGHMVRSTYARAIEAKLKEKNT